MNESINDKFNQNETMSSSGKPQTPASSFYSNPINNPGQIKINPRASKTDQTIYDIGFDDGYIQKEVEASLNLKNNVNKDLNLLSFENEKLKQQNQELYASLQSGFNILDKNARAYNSTREIFDAPVYPDRPVHEYYPIARNYIDNRKELINNRLKSFDNLKPNSDYQQKYLNEELAHLDSEWNQLERFKSESIDHVKNLEAKLQLERKNFENEKNNFQIRSKHELDELEKLRNKLADEKRDFEILSNNSRAEVNSINAELASKQEKIDSSINLLNQDFAKLEEDNRFLNNERIKLQENISKLQSESQDLENRKKMFEFEMEQARSRLSQTQNDLQAREENLERIQQEQKNKYNLYLEELKKIKEQILESRKQFDIEERERNKIRSDSESYLAARNLEVESKMAQVQRELEIASEQRFESQQEKEKSKKVHDENQLLLEDLKDEKRRLEIEAQSFEAMRKDALRDLDALKQNVQIQQNDLNNYQANIESDYKNRLNEIKIIKNSLKAEKENLSLEQQIAKEHNADIENLLNNKRKEIDSILFEANEKLTKANALKEWTEEKRNEVSKSLMQLQFMKKSIDQQKHDLLERERVNEEEISKIQSEVESKRAELERLYVVERERQEKRDAELNDFERNLKQRQFDFENNMDRERSNLIIRERELKDAYQRLTSKENEMNQKVEKLNFDLFAAQQAKENTFELQRKLKSSLEQVQQAKIELAKEREQLDKKSILMLEDLKAYESDLQKQKKEIDNLKEISEKEIDNSKEKLERERSDLFELKNKILEDKQNSSWEITRISHALMARQRSIKEQSEKLKAQQKEVSKWKELTAKEKNDVEKQLNDLAQEWDRLNKYKEEIETFRNDSINRLNNYENDIVSRHNELETYYENQKQITKEQQEKLEDNIKQLNEERKQFENQKQETLQKFDLTNKQLNERHNNLNISAARLQLEFKKFKELRDTQKLSQSEIDNKLQLLKKEQDELLSEQKKLEEARRNLTNQVQEYESKLRYKQNQILTQIQKNQETAKDQAERSAELKQAVAELKRDRERFDETKNLEFNQIQQKYEELERFELENSKIRNELEYKLKELESASKNTLEERQSLSKLADELTLKQKEFEIKESELKNQRSVLMRRVESFQSELTKRNELINSKHEQILQKAKLQEEKDKEIDLALKRLESEKLKFDDKKANEIAQIRKEQESLDSRQADLDKQAYRLQLQFKQLQTIRKITSADKNKFSKEFSELNRKRELIEKRVAEVEYNRSLVLSKLRSLEGQLQLRRQQIEIDELRLQKINKDQSNKSKEIEENLKILNDQRDQFNLNKNQELEKINKQYKEIANKEKEIDKKLIELKNFSNLISEKNKSIASNQYKLQKQYEQFYQLKKSVKQEQDKLEVSKNKAIKELRNFNADLNKKKDLIKSIYNKVKLVKKEQEEKEKKLEELKRIRDEELEKINKNKQLFSEKETEFNSNRQNELSRLNAIYQNLIKREKTLNKIGQHLEGQNEGIKEKYKDISEYEIKNNYLNPNNSKIKILNNQYEDKKDMNLHHHHNHHCNRKDYDYCTCYDQTPSFVPVAPANSINAITPYSNFYQQQQPGSIFNNPIMQMQQMIQHQQIQMLQHEHQLQLREANKERKELEKKLDSIRKWELLQKRELNDKLSWKNQHNSSRGYIKNNDEPLVEFLKQLAESTTHKLEKMQKEISDLKENKKNKPFENADDHFQLQKKQQQLALTEQRNMQLLEETKRLIAAQKINFDRERQALLRENQSQNLARQHELAQKEKEFKNLLDEMQSSFKEELNQLHFEKSELENKIKELSKANLQENNLKKSEEVNLVKKAQEMLAEEKARFDKEREALLNANIAKKEEAEKNSQEQNVEKNTLNINAQQPRRVEPPKPSAASNAKKMQIAQLTEQINAIKEMLSKK